MKLNKIADNPGARQNRKRVGRGIGSGLGKTAGRGGKGQTARKGGAKPGFEGGQMPIYRRLPKKGFRNAAFKVSYHVVNVGQLEEAFPAGARVDLDALKAAGLDPKKAKMLKVLGFGEITKALTIVCHGASAGARSKVEGVNGQV